MLKRALCTTLVTAMLLTQTVIAAVNVPGQTNIASGITGDAKVKIASGELQGFVMKTGVRAFLGVPYAAPPVGDLRWKAPQPVKPWNGTKEVKTNPPFAILDSRPATLAGTTAVWPTSEDCLYLNMWVPPADAMPKNGKYPVLVYMHGGGANISETRFMGDELARRGIIVVNVARRQGVLAGLALKELSDEPENKGSSGNLGMLDMIAGLKWIQDNIAQFGGDPNNVTLSGQSAGAQSCMQLQASPLTKGLYKRIFATSAGGTLSGTKPNAWNAVASAEAAGADWMSKFGTVTGTTPAKTVADLRAKTPQELFLVNNNSYGMSNLTAGADYILPDSPQNIFVAGRQNDVPIYIGWCIQDIQSEVIKDVTSLDTYKAALKAKFGNDADTVFNFYPAFNDKDAVSQAVVLNSEHSRAVNAVSWARLQKMTGRSPVYLHRFDRGNAQSNGFARHGYDNPYWKGKLNGAYAGNLFPLTTAADYQLSDRMMDSLVSWCKTGNPNTEYIKVPEYDLNDEKFVAFDVNGIATIPVSKGLTWFVDNAGKY